MRWFEGAIPEAISETKTKRCIFIVCIKNDSDASKELEGVLEDEAVHKKLEEEGGYVAVKVDINSESGKQFSQIYPVVVVPCVYFIGQNGIPLEIIAGKVQASNLVSKVENVIKLLKERQESKDAPGTSSPQSESSKSSDTGKESESSKASESKSESKAEGTPSPQSESSKSSDTGKESESSKASESKSESKAEVTTTQSVKAPNIQTDKASVSKTEEKLSNPSITNSEDTEAQAGPSSIPVEDRVERAKRLVAEKREQKLLEEQEDEKKKELERRKVGQEMQKMKLRQQDVDFQQLVEERNKEKAEDKAARDKIKQQIAQDRAERAAKFQAVREEETRKKQEEEQARAQAEVVRANQEAAAKSNTARLQLRLPTGSFQNHQFAADDTLEMVRQFVRETVRPTFGAFNLSTSFPRREFTENDFSQTLRDLCLAPSAVLLITPARSSGAAARGGTSSGVSQPSFSGSVSSMFWLLLSPIIAFLGFMRTFVFGQPAITPSPTNSRPSGRQQDQAQPQQRPQTRRQPGSSQAFSRREGNIHRIADDRDDDDENNTWNGNSTEQI